MTQKQPPRHYCMSWDKAIKHIVVWFFLLWSICKTCLFLTFSVINTQQLGEQIISLVQAYTVYSQFRAKSQLYQAVWSCLYDKLSAGRFLRKLNCVNPLVNQLFWNCCGKNKRWKNTSWQTAEAEPLLWSRLVVQLNNFWGLAKQPDASEPHWAALQSLNTWWCTRAQEKKATYHDTNSFSIQEIQELYSLQK